MNKNDMPLFPESRNLIRPRRGAKRWGTGEVHAEWPGQGDGLIAQGKADRVTSR